MTPVISILTLLMAGTALVNGIRIPAGLPDGNYVVVANADGVDEFVPVAENNMTETAGVTAPTKLGRRGLLAASDCSIPSHKTTCNTNIASLAEDDYFNALNSFTQSCDLLGSTQIKHKGKAHIAVSGHAVFFMCNYHNGYTLCVSCEMSAAASMVRDQCPRNDGRLQPGM
jgi:hypothetical protein